MRKEQNKEEKSERSIPGIRSSHRWGNDAPNENNERWRERERRTSGLTESRFNRITSGTPPTNRFDRAHLTT